MNREMSDILIARLQLDNLRLKAQIQQGYLDNIPESIMDQIAEGHQEAINQNDRIIEMLRADQKPMVYKDDPRTKDPSVLERCLAAFD